ncbi:hypothetical protein DL95DRAFT_414807 [Leptodontidium sp. 2 PMI_412]|nr:hypothetical protein DL95DRAFT_414807 [Leptodontidium sp. 2 PMI_412]
MLAILVTKDALPILALRASRGAIAIHQIPNLAQFSKNRSLPKPRRTPTNLQNGRHSIHPLHPRHDRNSQRTSIRARRTRRGRFQLPLLQRQRLQLRRVALKETVTVLRPQAGDPPLSQDQRQVGICYPEANFGSVAILSVSVAGCRYDLKIQRALANAKVVIGEQHTAGCTGKPIVTKSSSNPQCLNVNGTAPQNFYKFTCGN